jgi:NADH-quinone oxidoreductase subunit N
MNAIILSAVWGIVMMYSGIVLKQKSSAKYVATLGVILLIIVNWLEFAGLPLVNINTHGMLQFGTFGLLFNTVAFVSTLVYFLLSGSDMEQIGKNVHDYFALIFFVLSGVAIVSSFQSLLMLFIGIEIISIPLYILAGSAKKDLKSNEASLKYFLMGSFSTGLMLNGHYASLRFNRIFLYGEHESWWWSFVARYGDRNCIADDFDGV